MRNFKALALSAALAAVASASDVEVLTKDTFPEFVKGNDLVLAECKYYILSAQRKLPSLQKYHANLKPVYAVCSPPDSLIIDIY
jgi:hypothetical protein